MSDFVFSDFGQSIRKIIGTEKTSENSSTKKKSRANALKWFIGIFVLIFAIEAIIYLIVIPSMQTVTIFWSGERNLSVGTLSKVISPIADKSWVQFDSAEASDLLLNVSGIEDVQIAKRFPDKVYINIVEREPVAMTFVSDGNRSVPIQIDKNGVLFTTRFAQSDSKNGSELIDSSIPLISGIPIESTSSGMRIPVKYRGLLEQIAAIRELPQNNYFAAVSEIHIVPKEYGNYELVLYPIRGKIRILTGRQLTEEALQYMMVALDVVNMLEPNVAEIDLRYGSIAYRTKQSTGDSF